MKLTVLAVFDFYTARWPDFIVYLRTASSLRFDDDDDDDRNSKAKFPRVG